jgi:hypothetical protein
MSTPGKTVLKSNGKRGLKIAGKGAVYDENGECKPCCCQPKVIAQTITNSGNPVWDLTPYQGPGQATPGAYWRLIELGSCYPGYYPWYGAGCVDANGEMIGLPDQFYGNSYDGYMYLQQGCPDIDFYSQEIIQWPALGCQDQTLRYTC